MIGDRLKSDENCITGYAIQWIHSFKMVDEWIVPRARALGAEQRTRSASVSKSLGRAEAHLKQSSIMASRCGLHAILH